MSELWNVTLGTRLNRRFIGIVEAKSWAEAMAQAASVFAVPHKRQGRLNVERRSTP